MPSSNQIANLVLKNNLSLNNLNLVLAKYNAQSMLPIILKKLKSKIKLSNPTRTLEIATVLSPAALESLKLQLFKSDLEDVEVIINNKLLAGFRSTQNYKSIDASAERIINQIRN